MTVLVQFPSGDCVTYHNILSINLIEHNYIIVREEDGKVFTTRLDNRCKLLVEIERRNKNVD